MKNNFYYKILLLSIFPMLCSCSIIGGVFKTGMGVGILIVVVFIVLFVFTVSQFTNKND